MLKDLENALASIPEALRRPLLGLFEEALSEYRVGKWESVGIKAGKICEIVYSISEGKISGKYPEKPTKPKNMVDACGRLAQHNKLHGRSLCIQIPRVLVAVYELRNNREIGHVGSDVDPNHMDAELLIRSVKWLVAELVRVFGNLQTDEARSIVEAVTERDFHVVWSDGDAKRVLNTKLSAKQMVLVLTYASGGKADVFDLVRWSEYANASRLRSNVLKGLHQDALIHFDRKKNEVTLLPPGLLTIERDGLFSWSI